MKECLEKDLVLKSKQNIDDDNYVFDIFKDDSNKLLEMIEQGEDFSAYEKELDEDHLTQRLDLDKKKLKSLWGTLVPTIGNFYNESILKASNKVILD